MARWQATRRRTGRNRVRRASRMPVTSPTARPPGPDAGGRRLRAPPPTPPDSTCQIEVSAGGGPAVADSLCQGWDMPCRRKDAYYARAKAAGYRSRAAYKLRQVADRYQLIRRGDHVVDLGAWP